MPHRPPQPSQPGLPVHAACALPPAHALQRPGLHLAPHRTPSFSTRQLARAFNQPLGFDTSSVTTMGYMFLVRSAHALAPPSLHSRALFPCMPLVRCRRPTPSRPRPTPRPASYALLSTRQYASAFNQPLSFDTSSVTTMSYMFSVRSAHALAPPAFRVGPSRRACRSCAAAGPRPPTPGPHASPRIVRPAFRLGSKRRCSTSR